jgi:hypothetical protein
VIELPVGWERACLETALASAGLRVTMQPTPRGLATFRYGPDAAQALELAAQVAPGALCVALRAREPVAPTPALIEQLNDACIDSTFARLGFDADAGRITAAASVFAYPDFVPEARVVRWLCHALWEATTARLDVERLSEDFGAVPQAVVARVLADFASAGMPLAARPDGSWSRRFDTGDDGTIGLRLSFERGTMRLDALPLACPPWPDDGASNLALARLNARLLAGSVTRWGNALVIRQSIPLPFLPTHPQWVPTVIDAASFAALDVVRIAKGGPVERAGGTRAHSTARRRTAIPSRRNERERLRAALVAARGVDPDVRLAEDELLVRDEILRIRRGHAQLRGEGALRVRGHRRARAIAVRRVAARPGGLAVLHLDAELPRERERVAGGVEHASIDHDLVGGSARRAESRGAAEAGRSEKHDHDREQPTHAAAHCSRRAGRPRLQILAEASGSLRVSVTAGHIGRRRHGPAKRAPLRRYPAPQRGFRTRVAE